MAWPSRSTRRTPESARSCWASSVSVGFAPSEAPPPPPPHPVRAMASARAHADRPRSFRGTTGRLPADPRLRCARGAPSGRRGFRRVGAPGAAVPGHRRRDRSRRSPTGPPATDPFCRAGAGDLLPAACRRGGADDPRSARDRPRRYADAGGGARPPARQTSRRGSFGEQGGVNPRSGREGAGGRRRTRPGRPSVR